MKWVAVVAILLADGSEMGGVSKTFPSFDACYSETMKVIAEIRQYNSVVKSADFVCKPAS